MRMLARATFLVTVLLVIWRPSLLAKLPTVKVTVNGPGLTGDMELSDPKLLVSVWTGLPQKVEWPDYPQPFIGATVVAPPATFPRYSVSFFAGDATMPQPRVVYRVQYVPDLANRTGYIYLPSPKEPDGRLNESTIIRPQDGQWTRASAAWSEALNARLMTSSRHAPATACAVTEPNRHSAPNHSEAIPPGMAEVWYGNDAVGTALWPKGEVVFRPGGPGTELADGALRMKFFWLKGPGTHLTVEGHRLDDASIVLRSVIDPQFDSQGQQPSYLVFATPGCWIVTARAGGESLEFVTSVVNVATGEVLPK